MICTRVKSQSTRFALSNEIASAHFGASGTIAMGTVGTWIPIGMGLIGTDGNGPFERNAAHDVLACGPTESSQFHSCCMWVTCNGPCGVT